MKTFKKALSIILGVAIMLSCLFGMQVSVAAEETETPANPLAIGVGEVNVADGVVTVPVEVINNPGFITLSVIVGYNNEELQLTNSAKVADFATVAAPGNDVPSEVGEISPDFKEINWAYVTDEDVTATGTIATFTFKVLDETLASTDITLKVGEASNAADEDVTATAEGTTVVLKDEPVVPECTHENTEWFVDVPATNTTVGSKHLICSDCKVDIPDSTAVIPQLLEFATLSLKLQDSIQMTYKVSQNYFTSYGYTNPYVIFNLNGVETLVEEYTVEGGYYCFVFKNLRPGELADIVVGTIYATYDGELYKGEGAKGELNYSVKMYCEAMFKAYGKKTTLTSLLVDILDYGAAAQNYVGYKTDSLANADLTAEQASWGLSGAREYANHMAATRIESPTVNWLTAGLTLEDAIVLRVKLDKSMADLVGKTIKVSAAGKNWTYTVEDNEESFADTDGGSYLYFKGLNAGQFSEVVDMTVYDGDTAVSHTLHYSIETYAYQNRSTPNTKLLNLCTAIMNYGDSALANK